MKVCTVPGCDDRFKARGWCSKHYSRWLRHGDTDSTLDEGPNPMVCVCEVTDADPRVDAGMCHRCGRKPLALMKEAKA